MKKADLFIISVALVLLPSILFAQVPDTVWTRRYKEGPCDSTNYAFGCSVDSLGNLYVTGCLYDTTVYCDYLTIKYNYAGDTLWSSRYHGTYQSKEAYGCVADGLGNLYVTGGTYNGSHYYDYLTVKYNTTGDTLWVRLYNGPTDQGDIAYACAYDRLGNLYVTGGSVYNGVFDYLTIKYNTSGDTLWTQRYNGPVNSTDIAYGCAVDSTGNIYVTGKSYNGTTDDYLTIKYNSVGDTLWTSRYNGPANGNDYASGCIGDGSGNLYVTGYSSNGTNYDYLTIKYNSVGDTLWTSRYNGKVNGDDYARSCIVDDLGKLYVTGYSWDGVNWDGLTIKYDNNGDTLWTCKYDGPTGNSAQFYGCAVDCMGNLYVTGRYYNGVHYECLTVKYNTATGVAGKPELPITVSKLKLEQNRPNPFNQHTTISYQLPTSGPASLNIYNAAGQLVKTFDMGQQQAGHHQVEWSDSNIPAGVYFYRLTVGNYQATKKLVVLK